MNKLYIFICSLILISCAGDKNEKTSDVNSTIDSRWESYSVDCDQVRYYLIQAFDTDQGVRNGIVSYGTMEEVDQANQELLISILQCCGPEKIVSAGDRATMATFLILQHAPNDLQLKYFDLLEKWAKEGIIPARTFVLMIDRIRMFQNKPQLFGSQISTDEDGVSRLYKVDDLQKVKHRRDSLRMELLEDYLLRFDAVLDTAYAAN